MFAYVAVAEKSVAGRAGIGISCCAGIARVDAARVGGRRETACIDRLTPAADAQGRASAGRQEYVDATPDPGRAAA